MEDRLIPIAAVLSPASLTTQLSIVANSTICPSVPNLNFSAESFNNFRDPVMKTGGAALPLCYYNTTDINGTTPGYFDYFDQPSKQALRLGTMSVYSKKVVQLESKDDEGCGSDWNCTYTISFQGPGYKCSELASGVDSNTADLHRMGAPFDTNSLVPVGNMSYQAVVDIGEYITPQGPTDDGIASKPWPKDLGVIKTEPVIWIGYTVNTSDPLPSDSPYSKWNTVQIPKVFSCIHYETNYTVLIDYSGGQQKTTVTDRKFMAPIINTTLSQFPNGTLDPQSAFPSSNWVRPEVDRAHYQLTAAYHSLGLIFRQWLSGTVEKTHPLWTTTKSEVTETRLIDTLTFYNVPDLQVQVQSLYEDIILTLLSNPQLLVCGHSSVPCVKSRRVSLFHYRARDLWAGYSTVILIALVFIGVGMFTLAENGIASGTGFSRILATTRNPTLDRLSVGACLGGDPFPNDLMHTKLKFGVMQTEETNGMSAEHCAFGTEDQVRTIVKGRRYAGLRSRRRESA
jgi:hypothetical protein